MPITRKQAQDFVDHLIENDPRPTAQVDAEMVYDALYDAGAIGVFEKATADSLNDHPITGLFSLAFMSALQTGFGLGIEFGTLFPQEPPIKTDTASTEAQSVGSGVNNAATAEEKLLAIDARQRARGSAPMTATQIRDEVREIASILLEVDNSESAKALGDALEHIGNLAVDRESLTAK